MKLYDYQTEAVNSTMHRFIRGQSVCLVAPTGAGKTIMGKAIAERFKQPLVIVHRRELLMQAKRKFPATASFATIQGLVSSGVRPKADVVILDECHHYLASEWNQVATSYKNNVVGLTATPQRSDGTPLGDLFDSLVVATSYSVLLHRGILCPCDVYRPISPPGKALAMHPVDAYLNYCSPHRAFVYCQSVDHCLDVLKKFTEKNIGAAVIHAGTPKEVRDSYISSFNDGTIKVLINVHCLTEGVDVPAATGCIIARSCSSVASYMQMAGRVLRSHHDKQRARLIDLAGVTYNPTFGSPTDDRAYSLTGIGMASAHRSIIKTCPSCFMICTIHQQTCSCGYAFKSTVPLPEVKKIPLRMTTINRDETIERWEHILSEALAQGCLIEVAVKRFRARYGTPPPISHRERIQLRRELQRLGKAKGFKQGWAFVREKILLGET